MNLQQGGARAQWRCNRTFIRRHFHTLHELSRTQINKHPPRRLSFKTRVVSQAAVPFARARLSYISKKGVSQRKYFSDSFKSLFNKIPSMTLIQKVIEAKAEKMDGTTKEHVKVLRPVRNRRYTRRCLVAGQRPQKRLFTPEIKRYLKDWLVRRRDNPYPNREEKKHLSRETGLTYIQICNWFANWRRKLKNVNADRDQHTWGHLIRTYNDRAQGNVEQFSICSDDSIWSEPEPDSPEHLHIERRKSNVDSDTACNQDTDTSSTLTEKYESFNNNSNEIDHCDKSTCDNNITSPILLSKWLASAARFQPSETNYSWWAEGRRRKEQKIRVEISTLRHDRDEVEAAVALTALATGTTRVTAP